MHSHKSYPNITAVVVTSIIVLLSIIVPSRHPGIGAWVNSKMGTSRYCIIPIIIMQGYSESASTKPLPGI